MKTIKITISELYANVTPDLPHFKAEEGRVVELEDGLANLILNRRPEPGGEIYTPEEDDGDDDIDIDKHVDIHPDVLRMSDDNNKATLVEVCKQLNLDVTGNKSDLAQRLIDNEVTQGMIIQAISEDSADDS